MLAAKMLQTTEFVVDAQGNKKAVLLDYQVWEELLTLIQDWEDAEEIRRLRESAEETIPWEQAKHRVRLIADAGRETHRERREGRREGGNNGRSNI